MSNQQYKLIDGHVYFGNKICKLRYDLMKTFGTAGSNQDIYFNKYKNVLKLGDQESIKTNSPIVSVENHRFAYVTLSKNLKDPKKVTVVPYLHERKVYLNRKK